MYHLHIFKNTNQKFSEPYIEFIKKNFPSNEHHFLLIGRKVDNKLPLKDNVTEVTFTLSNLAKIIKLMNNNKKIFLHGLFSPQVVLLLFLQPWLLKKCYWIIWGGDLYYHNFRANTIKADIYEVIRKSVIRHMGGFITHIKGDYDLVKKWYSAKGKYYYSFIYPSNLYMTYDVSDMEISTNKILFQVGNSGDPSNNHIEILHRLSDIDNKNFKIICPLSYGGSQKYISQVLEKGKGLFGDNFIPLTEFMSFDEYIKILASVDIAIFNHNRQQAVGNITTLLSLGKKVYLRDDITTWGFCADHGLRVFNLNNGLQDVLEPIPDESKYENIKVIRAKFSKEKLISDWEKIFSGKN